ncbi:hypothetical protein AHF37_03084 [Paragonimus kellicotti]|nr:hypothetical protein AHF37_03084 [Paragonimus kellicotti]
MTLLMKQRKYASVLISLHLQRSCPADSLACVRDGQYVASNFCHQSVKTVLKHTFICQLYWSYEVTYKQFGCNYCAALLSNEVISHELIKVVFY